MVAALQWMLMFFHKGRLSVYGEDLRGASAAEAFGGLWAASLYGSLSAFPVFCRYKKTHHSS
jgi:hypothetical protein